MDEALDLRDNGHTWKFIKERTGISASTVRDHLNGHVRSSKKGRQSLFTPPEEEQLMTWACLRARLGFAPRSADVIDAAREMLRNDPQGRQMPGQLKKEKKKFFIARKSVIRL